MDAKSLSARRAWIEIKRGTSNKCGRCVALRKESVDRNFLGRAMLCSPSMSLSARRAWIEMQIPVFGGGGNGRRSPQGERG